MNRSIILWIKLITAALLFLALADLPYGYYRFLRLEVFVAGIVCAFMSINGKRNILGIIFGAIVILFNPIFPIYFSRETWQPIDIVVGIIFIISIFIEKDYKGIEES